MNDRVVAISVDENARYPAANWNYSPGKVYPEYPYADISPQPNLVYDMVRKSFYLMGFDHANYGKKEWNPLSSFIKKGDHVLLKPNWVKHFNPQGSLESLVTHPAVIRAVLDYVIKALDGTGRIAVADAPVQSCDLSMLFDKGHYCIIWEFYRKLGIDIKTLDMRQAVSHVKRGIVERHVNLNTGNENFTVVDLGSLSAHHTNEEYSKRLRITNYDPEKMYSHHSNGKHEYLIHGEILNADVVITLPKPKSHRKAGLTAALKNNIGINGNKEWLPHHTKGSVLSGGDEYNKNSNFKAMASKTMQCIDRLSEREKYRTARLIRWFVYAPVFFICKYILMDKTMEGSWWGNNTISKTVVDVSRILLYSDKKGHMSDKIQRNVFVLGDMIVSGDHEGPLEPRDKPFGAIVTANDMLAFDETVAAMVGFDASKIPTIQMAKESGLPLSSQADIRIFSNNSRWNEMTLDKIEFPAEWRFAPSLGWAGHIENYKY